MLDLVQYRPHTQITPSTGFRMGDFTEISDFSSTTLFWRDDTGKHKAILIPTEYFPLVMERNARIFVWKVFGFWVSDLSEESLYEYLNPLTNGPVSVMIFIDSLFYGRYNDINFDLSKFVGGWGRQFKDEGYTALSMLMERQMKECDEKEKSSNDPFPKNFLFDLHSESLIQRFIEWDEERYLSFVLGLDYTEKKNISEIHARLRAYIKTLGNSTEEKLLYRALCSIQDNSLTPKGNNEMPFNFLGGILNLGKEKVFDAIVNSSLEELCILKVVDTYFAKEYALKFEILTYASSIPLKWKKIEDILQTVSVEYFTIIFDKAKWEEEKKYLLRICKTQLKEIYTRVTSGDTIPYARIIHFIASGKSADATDIFFGISWLLMKTDKRITCKENPLLPHKKSGAVTSRIRWTVTDLVRAKTTGGIVQSKIIWAVTSGKDYKESLLYDFHKDFYPIGAKIHFPKPITAEQIAILHQIVGFWSTPFKLLHADTSLCLPACQSPMQLIAILHRLAEMEIISDDTLELQLTMAGRVPNDMAG
ncbi:MAG: hypothetical protein ACD_71C00141G0001, partial [uncultured bacterium (gcode 4)]